MAYNTNELISGDITGNISTTKLTSIDGYALPVPSGTNAVLTYNDGYLAWSQPIVSNSYALFFALMPGDNSATVAVGAPVQFPQDGPNNGGITRINVSTFNLLSVGTYEVTWQVSIDEPGQLQLAIGGVGLSNTVVGRATGSSQLFGSTLITTVSPNSILSVINPSGNSTALTITPNAGGASAVSATLLIKAM
jgi:hypothetical protein